MRYQSSKTILVIEDDDISRHLFLNSLTAEGFRTIGAENGTIGILQTQKYLPDLIICDLLMPGMDGYDVLTTLRKDPLTAIIPFIFLTANNSTASIRKGMELGADDYLSKPVTINKLLTAITVRLEKHSLLRYFYGKNSDLVSEVSQNIEKSQFAFPKIPHLQKVFDYIEAHYHEGITLSDVAQAVDYSPAYLTHQVSQQTGKSINAWIVKRRMAAACYLLKQTNLTIEEIATKIGYQNTCYFSRQFSQHHHKISPKTWRQKNQLPDIAAHRKQQFIKSKTQFNPRISC
ncbi:DNA-binding response regulator [Okeanomitos corallinicola TIOX110]|uniref:DNA-binding response regulator n=1 Tax=Okeanomitos corallinicola TIOX110 TaxID=3133117 RepID=A0ABZ2UN00_9CYAN